MSGNGNGHHWSKFCWRDWQSDRALRACSLAARGFWIECLAAMHEGEPVGHLTINGQPATPKQLAANAYCSEREAVKLLAELEAANVFSRTTEGVIYSRRMVRDATLSEQGREHVKKRWERPPPNSPPNRVANSPPTRKPNGEATRPPITQESEPESEVQPVREKESILLTNLSLEKKLAREARAGARSASPVPNDALTELLDEAQIEPPEPFTREPDEPLPELVAAHVRRVAKACSMRVPYGEVRSVEAQLAALQSQPQAVGADVSMGLRWRPCEPVRTVAEQLAWLQANP